MAKNIILGGNEYDGVSRIYVNQKEGGSVPFVDADMDNVWKIGLSDFQIEMGQALNLGNKSYTINTLAFSASVSIT